MIAHVVPVKRNAISADYLCVVSTVGRIALILFKCLQVTADTEHNAVIIRSAVIMYDMHRATRVSPLNGHR